MNEAFASDPSSVDDLATWLAKAVSGRAQDPKLITFSPSPAQNAMNHVFGAASTINLVRRPNVGAADTPFALADGTPSAPTGISTREHAVVARFIDPVSLSRVLRESPEWIAGASAVVVHFSPGDEHVRPLLAAGLVERRRFLGSGRPITAFTRRDADLRARLPRTDLPARQPMRRLVIVDPCLGVAAGHYRHYAEMITSGARSLDVEAVWACHAGFDESSARGLANVRGCFPRCFFDLGPSETSTDLSGEMAAAWTGLLHELDHPQTHFLVHSADAHQLRALGALLRNRPAPQSVIHVNIQSGPRFLPGRVAGVEAHRAIRLLTDLPVWERGLFLWTETGRLGTWMSHWLGGEIPAAPPLAVWTRAPSQAASPRLTISFLGEGRVTKGFLDLPNIADHIAATPGLANAVSLVVQDWAPFRADQQAHEAAVSRLRRHRFVTVIEGVLSTEAYEEQLAAAQVLLLPYDPHGYALQGSGILVEGLARGAVIVARAGASLAEETDDGVVFAFHDVADLMQILCRIARDRDMILREAADRARRFRANSTPRRYVASLDARARGPRPI